MKKAPGGSEMKKCERCEGEFNERCFDGKDTCLCCTRIDIDLRFLESVMPSLAAQIVELLNLNIREGSFSNIAEWAEIWKGIKLGTIQQMEAELIFYVRRMFINKFEARIYSKENKRLKLDLNNIFKYLNQERPNKDSEIFNVVPLRNYDLLDPFMYKKAVHYSNWTFRHRDHIIGSEEEES
jgi:hypothetical protein